MLDFDLILKTPTKSEILAHTLVIQLDALLSAYRFPLCPKDCMPALFFPESASFTLSNIKTTMLDMLETGEPIPTEFLSSCGYRFDLMKTNSDNGCFPSIDVWVYTPRGRVTLEIM